MKTVMLNLEKVSELVRQKKYLYLAGDEKLLSQLPAGNWIGGTIPYFMTQNGGIISEDLIQVTYIPSESEKIKISEYSSQTLPNLADNYYSNGLSLIIIPAFSKTHETFAKDCSTWNGVFNQPLVGWISGVNLNNKNQVPKVFNGLTNQSSTDKAIVMHLALPASLKAEANIINIFEQGTGDTLTFNTTGFNCNNVLVNGQPQEFSTYLKNINADLKLPLVADYMGAKVNVSIKEIDSNGQVILYAPIFPGVTYKLAKPVNNYEQIFIQKLKEHNLNNVFFSCNCILNFLYAKLEGKKIGDYISAMTFGEIAYMLLNQTFVYIEIKSSK